jgi:hypothetical protein
VPVISRQFLHGIDQRHVSQRSFLSMSSSDQLGRQDQAGGE